MKIKKISVLILVVALTIVVNSTAIAQPARTFSSAKKTARKIFSDHRITLYCGCKYDRYGKINLKSCHMESANRLQRAHRLEWEHMTPASNLLRQLSCGQEKICVRKNGKHYKGRKCCRKVSKKFRKMEAELFNLWPSVGAVNAARSNLRYGAFYPEGNKYNFYGCPIIIDKHYRAVEPRDAVKGIVARANLFMSSHYNIKLSKGQRRLFENWNRRFPPSNWEKLWESRVATIEGYHNFLIKNKT